MEVWSEHHTLSKENLYEQLIHCYNKYWIVNAVLFSFIKDKLKEF